MFPLYGKALPSAGCSTVRLWMQLLGFPIQLAGLLLLPYVVVKYAVDGDDYIVDIQNAAVETLDFSSHLHLERFLTSFMNIVCFAKCLCAIILTHVRSNGHTCITSSPGLTLCVPEFLTFGSTQFLLLAGSRRQEAAWL